MYKTINYSSLQKQSPSEDHAMLIEKQKIRLLELSDYFDQVEVKLAKIIFIEQHLERLYEELNTIKCTSAS